MLLISFVTTLAFGQNEGSDLPWGCRAAPIGGLVAQDTVQQARQTNNQIYGAVGFAERQLFPALHHASSAGAFELNTLYGAGYVPSGLDGCNEEFASVVNQRVDLFSSSAGLAVGAGPFTFFYAGSVTGHSYARRFWSALEPYGYAAGGIGLAYLGPLGPLLIGDGADSPIRSRNMDWFMGVDAKAGKLFNGRIAYVGSQGFYANATGTVVKLVGASAIRPKDGLFTEAAIDYLKAGLVEQNYPGQAELAGLTSLYVQKKDFVPATSGAIADAPVSEVEIPFMTGNFSQKDMGGWVDIDLSYSWAPQPLLHTAHIGVHTPGYWVLRSMAERKDYHSDLDADELDTFGVGAPLNAGIFAGTTQLPAMPWYGVQGGPSIFWRAEVLIGGGGGMDPGDAAGLVGARVQFNDPELLTQFPYAHNAMSFQLFAGGSFM